MGSMLRQILYYLNVIALVIAFGGFIYSLTMLFVHYNEHRKWIVAAGIFVVAFILLLLLFVVRKSRFPVAGKDFY